MSDGQAHDAHGIVFAAICTPILAFSTGSTEIGICSGLGVIFGALWLSPDLDLKQSRPFKRWGPLRIFWWPYARLMPHRGLSHHWFWGPLGRLVYLTAFLLPLWLLAGGGELSPLLITFLCGTIFGNWIHLLADGELF